MKTILVVEDELKIAQNIQKGLQEEGYPVEVIHDGETALEKLTQQDYELIILDVMLPKMDGWLLLNHIKAYNATMPVIMLTALNDVENRIKGLKNGADDYLSKPFVFAELLARVEAILRRTRQLVAQDRLEVEELTLFLLNQTVLRGGLKIELSSKEFQLLCLLAEHSGRLVSRKEIAKRIWQIDFDTETNMVDVAIRRLRQKLDEPFDYPLIHTVRGVGYVLEKR